MRVEAQSVKPAVIHHEKACVSEANHRQPNVHAYLMAGAVVLDERLDIVLRRKRIGELQDGKIGGELTDGKRDIIADITGGNKVLVTRSQITPSCCSAPAIARFRRERGKLGRDPHEREWVTDYRDSVVPESNARKPKPSSSNK